MCDHCSGICNHCVKGHHFINDTMEKLTFLGIKKVNTPVFIDDQGEAKACKCYEFNVDESILQKIQDLKLKYIFVVAWDGNNLMIRGSD